MADEPPPAYKEPEAKTLKDGPATATTTTTVVKKERVPDTPAEEGEGILSSPLKRMTYIGVILLLYYILSFWKPVYWMAGAANFCKFQCNTWPATQQSSGSISIGSSYVSIGSSYGNGFGFSGCYESIDPSCDDQCDVMCKLYESQDLGAEYLDLLYESTYSTSSREARLASFALIVIGFIFGCIGVIIAYFAVKKGSRMLSPICSILIGLGCLLSIVGAIIFMATWHENIDFEEVLAAWQIMVFIEYLLPGIIGIILAIDIFTYAVIFNNNKKRMFALTIPFAILCFMGGILFAYIINWEPDPPANIFYEFGLYDECACIAAGYFILSLMSIGRILIYGEYVNVNPTQIVMIKFILSILLIIGALITACGYWAMIDTLFDCELNILTGSKQCDQIWYLPVINGDRVGMTYAHVYDVNYEGQFKCYYVSYTFFILLITILNAYDMDIIGNYKKIKLAQQAANTAASTN